MADPRSEVMRIDVREARRLKERFLNRATAVFYARLAFLVLGLGILALPSWRAAFGADTVWAVPWYLAAIGYTVGAQTLATHPRHGRWVMFATLNLDLVLLSALIANTGGITSPIMAGQLLFTLFFSLLFPNAIASIPPLVMLPVVVRLGQLGPVPQPPLIVLVLFLLWYTVLNGVVVYVTVYLTAREEEQNREILELEYELKKLAVVEERNRLARDIHDGLGASLSGLIIQSEYLLTLSRDKPELHGEVQELKGAAEEAIDEVRRALSMMRDEFELVPQLENACTTYTTRHRIPVKLEIDGEPPALSDDQQLTIFRIMQECLTNTAKHAECSKVTVNVDFRPDGMKMLIVDDGKGFEAGKRPKGHYGLLNMKERARKVGGEVDIASTPGEGTTIRLEIPVSAAPVSAA